MPQFASLYLNDFKSKAKMKGKTSFLFIYTTGGGSQSAERVARKVEHKTIRQREEEHASKITSKTDTIYNMILLYSEMLWSKAGGGG